MKNKMMKRTLSLVLAVMTVLSVMVVSVGTASAATGDVNYNLEFKTAGSQGTTNGDIVITVHGTAGSTSAHNVGEVGDSQKLQTASFTDVNVGEITGVTVDVISGINDGWYPEYINVSTPTDTETIYGGRWVDDDKKVTMNVTDTVLKVQVVTGDVTYAGTNGDVKIRFKDTNNKQTTTFANLSSIHPDSDAFERKDDSTFYVYAGSDFGAVKSIEILSGGDGIFGFGADWYLYSITITNVSGFSQGASCTKVIDQWLEDGHGVYKFSF